MAVARLIALSFVIVALAHPALVIGQTSEPIKITVSPERLKAEANQHADIILHLNFPVRPGGGPVVVDVKVSSGTVNPRRVHGAGQEVKLRYTTPPDPRPGEVEIAVEACQGVSLLGQCDQIGTRWRGIGRLSLVPVSRSRPVSPPSRRPPFKPTAGPVNPYVDMASRAGQIAAVLTVLAGLNWVFSRSRRDRRRRWETRPAPFETMIRRPPEVEPEAPTKPWDGKQDAELKVAVEAPASVDGDGEQRVELKITVTSDYSVELRSITVKPSREGYQDLGSKLELKRDVRVAWEWEDCDVIFTVEVVAEIRLERLVSRRGTASCTVRVGGAKPSMTVRPEPDTVCATGENEVTIHCDLELFGRSTSERVRIESITGKLGGKELKPTVVSNDEKRQATWVPPFLLQERDYAEPIELNVQAAWVGGTLYERAQRARKPFPKLEGWDCTGPNLVARRACEVLLRGCTVKFWPDMAEFFPLPGAELAGRGWLEDADGQVLAHLTTDTEVRDPRFAPVHKPFPYPAVTIEYAVADLTQGPPVYVNGCKLPPALPTAKEAESQIRQAPWRQVLAVRTPTADEDKRKISLLTYQKREGEEPIAGGAVVSRLRVNEGFGGSVEVTEVSEVQLGVLVLETGGPQFHIYENDVFCFELEHQPARAICKNQEKIRVQNYGQGAREVPYVPGEFFDLSAGRHIPDPDARFVVEFAVVDEDGKPVCSAGSKKCALKLRKHPKGDFRNFELLIGHMPKDYAIVFRAEDLGSREAITRYRRDLLVEQQYSPSDAHPSRLVGDSERDLSLWFRRIWHQLPFSEETGLPFLGSETKESPWRDKVLSLAVRIELWDAQNNLIATSDRLAGGGGSGRTDAKWVWRDHQFKYVLLALRLRLQDSFGRQYANKKYKLHVEGVEEKDRLLVENATTNGQGLIEQLLPPGAEKGRLELFPGDSSQDPFCTFDLKLGDPYGKDMLNNLGFFASPGDKNQYQRAVQRFQALFNSYLAQGDDSQLARGGRGFGSLGYSGSQALEATHQLGLPDTTQASTPSGGGKP